MAKQQDNIRKWALIGAEQRLIELAEEAAAINREFPELRERDPRKRPAAAVSPAAPSGRRRRKMSTEARRKISEAQKARWAKQKKK
jgi:hypothetical protein